MEKQAGYLRTRGEPEVSYEISKSAHSPLRLHVPILVLKYIEGGFAKP